MSTFNSNFYKALATKDSREEFLNNLTEEDIRNLTDFISRFEHINENFEQLNTNIRMINEAFMNPRVKKVLIQENIMDFFTGGIGKLLTSVIPNLDEIKDFINSGAKIMPLLGLILKAVEWIAPKLGLGGDKKPEVAGGQQPAQTGGTPAPAKT